jgi:hypothetical protein
MSASARAPRALFGASGLLLAVALACTSGGTGGGGGDDDEGGNGGKPSRVCVPASAAPCVGPGACDGTEYCVADGSGFGPCLCGVATGGTTGAGGTNGQGGGAAQGGTLATGGASGTGQGGAGKGGASGSSGTGGSGGAARIFKTCVAPCTSAADCDLGTLGSRAGNFRCTDGGCQRTGCIDDTECDMLRAGMVCRPYPGTPYKSCNVPCTTAAVCGYQNNESQAWGPDNYSCTDGQCIYAGCNSTAECVADFVGRPTIACQPGGPYPACNFTCQAPTDCVMNGSTPINDADNFTCENGFCVNLGCSSDAECNAYNPATPLCRPL